MGLLVPSIAHGSRARADATISVTMPGSLQIAADASGAGCPAEDLFAQGQLHLVYSINPDQSLDIKLQSFQGTAVGASGTVYQISNVTTSSSNGDIASGPGEATLQSDLVATSDGSAPNFVSHALFHVTVDANGVTEVSISSLSTECRG